MGDIINKKSLFIGGTGRCGTNITRKIFSQHPLVGSLPFEYRYIIDPDGIIDFYQSFSNSWSPYMADVKIKRFQTFLENLAVKKLDKKNYKDWELNNWFPNYQKNIEVLINQLKTFQYGGFWPGAKGDASTYQIFFSEHKNKKILSVILGEFVQKNIHDYLLANKKHYFVEDNTWNILFSKEISELMPESKLLHLVRDPRDVIVSFMNQNWCPNEFDKALLMYKSIIEKWFQVEEKLPKNFYKIIKLENLVKKSEVILRDVCEFSGIPFHSNLLNVKLNKSNEGRWRDVLTKDNQKVVKEELANVFLKLNYKL